MGKISYAFKNKYLQQRRVFFLIYLFDRLQRESGTFNEDLNWNRIISLILKNPKLSRVIFFDVID